MDVQIFTLTAPEAQALVPQLTSLLADAVKSNASVGFLPPLDAAESQHYWQSVVAAALPGSSTPATATARSSYTSAWATS